MADYLSLNEEALIQKCQEKNIPHEGKSVTELRVLLIQSCAEKAPGAGEVDLPLEAQLRREQMALEREKMEMEAREAKEKRELERARMEHEWRKVQMEVEKAKLDTEVKIPQQQWRSEMACTEKASGAAEVGVPWEVQLRREEMALEREKMEMEAREAKEKRELERARMEHEWRKVQMELEKAKLDAEVKIPQQQQWRSETARTEKAPGAAEVDLPLEAQLRREQMALEREKMEMETREAKEKRELERARLEHEWRKVQMELEKAKLEAEVKIPQQQWRRSCTEKAPGAAEVDLPLEAELRRAQMALEREKTEMEAREAKEKRELERARMEHEQEKARMKLEKAKLDAEVKVQQQQWRSEMASLLSSKVTSGKCKAFAPRDDPHTSLNTSEKAERDWGVKGEDFMRSTEPTQTTAMADANLKESIKKYLSVMKVSMGQRSLQNVLADADKELKLLENARLDIAFTGVSGAGKSSLVNAFFNIEVGKKAAAKTGVIQTTMEPERYPHPQFPELTLWDLPGIGTREFHPKEYLQKVNFSRYDFFIIVAAERFTVNDAMLASEIQKMDKQFYFVRTKMDQAMEAERRNPNFNEERTVEKIRKYCLSNLIKEGAVNPRVFLISSWHLNMYEFPLLQMTLANELNDLKRPLLIMAMPALSKAHLQEKKAAMEAVIWKKALMSCRTRLFPFPGLSLHFDTGLLVTILKDFRKAFGLDEDSLRSLAKRVSKPFDELLSAVKRTPKANQINPEFVLSRMTASRLDGSAIVLEELSEFTPVLADRSDSFATTFHMLKRFLEDAMEDAKNVLAIVVE